MSTFTEGFRWDGPWPEGNGKPCTSSVPCPPFQQMRLTTMASSQFVAPWRCWHRRYLPGVPLDSALVEPSISAVAWLIHRLRARRGIVVRL